MVWKGWTNSGGSSWKEGKDECTLLPLLSPSGELSPKCLKSDCFQNTQCIQWEFKSVSLKSPPTSLTTVPHRIRILVVYKDATNKSDNSSFFVF